MDCQSCGAEVPSGDALCSECRCKLRDLYASRSPVKCRKCENMSPPSAKFCAECGGSTVYDDRNLAGLRAAGILTIAASAFCAACGIACFYVIFGLNEGTPIALGIGLTEVLACGFGFTSGILILQRCHNPLVVFGQVLIVLIACGLAVFDFSTFLILGMVPLVFAVTAIALTHS